MNKHLARVPDEAEKSLASLSWLGTAGRWLLQRYPVWPIVKYLADKKVPNHRYSPFYSLGGLALFFLTIQILTGILLMVYYQPSAPWTSVQKIVNEVPFGHFVRSIHHWSANLMILTVFIHFISTFFMKAYRVPRELTWLTGVGLFGLTLLFGFSGYLLPWDELSFFATRVGISEADKIPVVGPWIAGLARGGDDVTIATINRFYALHVVVLPLLVLGLAGVHLLFIQIQGISEPDCFLRTPRDKRTYDSFFTDYLPKELLLWLLALAVLVFLAAFFPRPLGPEADVAAAAPLGIKPEWYFLSQYQLLKLFTGWMEPVGVLLMGAVPAILLLVPFVDRKIPAGRGGAAMTWLGVMAAVSFVFFTLWGWWS